LKSVHQSFVIESLKVFCLFGNSALVLKDTTIQEKAQ